MSIVRVASEQVASRKWKAGTLLVFCLLIPVLLSACAFPGTSPTFKLGLVAPFEGRYRPIGYDAIYAARLAVRQANAQGGAGGWRVELIALDDGGDPAAAVKQARMLALDPAVVGVIGHLRADTTQAASAVYAQEGLPLLVPANVPAGESASATSVYLGPSMAQLNGALQDAARPAGAVARLGVDAIFAAEIVKSEHGVLAGGPDLGLADFAKIAGLQAEGTVFVTGAPWPQDVAGAEQFIASYEAVSGGSPPGPYAWATFQAAQMLLEATRRDIQLNGLPSRQRIASELQTALAKTAPAQFAPVYVYRYDQAGCPQMVEQP